MQSKLFGQLTAESPTEMALGAPLPTIRRLSIERGKRFTFYKYAMIALFVIPHIPMHFMYDYQWPDAACLIFFIPCYIPALAIFFLHLLPFVRKKDPHAQLVSLMSESLQGRNEETLRCWAEAYGVLNPATLRTLRPRVSDILLHQPQPVLDFDAGLCYALNTEVLYTWNDPEQTNYAVKIIQLLGDNASGKYIGNLETLSKARPKNQHETYIQQALIGVLPNWKARM